jgi:hypothetical protein
MGQFLIRKKITARGALLISQAKLPAGLERDPVFFLFFQIVGTNEHWLAVPPKAAAPPRN